MAGSRVAVFLLNQGPRREPFLTWASLVGPQVALLHLPKGARARDGTACRCEIYERGVATEVIGATLRRSTALRSIPPFAFLDSGSTAEVAEVSDPRLWASNLSEVRTAIWEFVATQAESDPPQPAEPAVVAGDDQRSREPERVSQVIQAMAAKKPWWCKLFRSAPGCN